VVRTAFTLIELIFAIVVIAISVLSLPMMSQVTAEGIDNNLVQEAIFGSATKLNEAVTAHWDGSSIEPGMPDSFARVIETGTCESNPLATDYRQMPGHINQPLHRRCLDSNLTAPVGAVAGVTSLDNFAGASAIFMGASSAEGYKDTYTATVVVTRGVTFGSLAGNPNIKRIVSTITNADGPVAALRTYSMNIGEVDYYKRSY